MLNKKSKLAMILLLKTGAAKQRKYGMCYCNSARSECYIDLFFLKQIMRNWTPSPKTATFKKSSRVMERHLPCPRNRPTTGMKREPFVSNQAETWQHFPTLRISNWWWPNFLNLATTDPGFVSGVKDQGKIPKTVSRLTCIGSPGRIFPSPIQGGDCVVANQIVK